MRTRLACCMATDMIANFHVLWLSMKRFEVRLKSIGFADGFELLSEYAHTRLQYFYHIRQEDFVVSKKKSWRLKLLIRPPTISYRYAATAGCTRVEDLLRSDSFTDTSI